MDENIMHDKISDALKSDAETDKHQKIDCIEHPKHDAQPTGDGKKQREKIIFLKHPVLMDMMVFM